MNPQLLYLEDPLKLEFDTTIQQRVSLPDGRIAIILDQTYFYPTGGGQEHDTGTLGEARVVEVFKEGDEPVLVHVVDHDLPLGMVHACIDRERRLRHMQHHTAQHLISQCFLQLDNIESLSANINGYTPSTVDLATSAITPQQLERAEDLANRIVFEDRPVRSYFVTPEQLRQLPLRWPPKVQENIRIVEITGFDYSACGGTHCTSTGSIGLVKILKTERQNEKTRIHFVAGLQALQYFRQAQEIVTDLANRLSTHPQEIIPSIHRQTEQLKQAQKELQALRFERIGVEAQKLAEAGEMMGSRRVVVATFGQRPIIELRALADEFKRMLSTVAVLATWDGQKLALVVTSGEKTGLSARDLLNRLLAPIGGRGGGDGRVAQGGGTATAEQFRAFDEEARRLVQGSA